MCAASMRAGRGRRALRCDALRWRPLLALLSVLLAASPVSTAEAAGFTVVWPGSDFKTVVEAAAEGHWIHFLPGVYNVPEYGCNLMLAKNISMIAVVGTGERGSVPGNPPVLDCAGQERHFSVRAGVQVLLEGIHLRNGRAGDGQGAGGCIAVGEGAQLTIRNSRIEGCHSANDGGALGISAGARVRMEHSRVEGCSSDRYGGALSLKQAELIMDSVAVQHNIALNDGGGLHAEGSSIEMQHSTVSENQAAAPADFEYTEDAPLVSGSRGGGLYADRSSISANNSSIVGNSAHHSGGGLYLCCEATASLKHCAISDNQALAAGGGIYAHDRVRLQLQNQSSVARNQLGDEFCEDPCGDGAGIYAYSRCIIEITDSILHENVSPDEGGAFHLNQNSEMHLFRSRVLDNFALYYGGGGCALSSAIYMQESAVSGNECDAFGSRGGGIYASSDAVVRLMNSDILNNVVRGGMGGGLQLSHSEIDARGCTFAGNKALGGHGGALSLRESSKGSIMDCFFESNAASAEGCGNEAWDYCGGGGAVSLADSTLQVLGDSRLLLNSAMGDSAKSSGGAMLAWGSSKVRLKGTELLQNTAADAGGGAIALQQDSTLECDGTSFINNTARGNGGALFVGSALFQSQNIPVSFRGNTLFEGNVAENEGEGGAIYSNRPIEFMPGGFSAARRNSAHGMGGAVLLSDCELVLGYGHQIEASHNEAGLDGGAFALQSGATIILEKETCSSNCVTGTKSDGTCNPECMNRECDWDGGDCLHLLEAAGENAQQPCDRDECTFLAQTSASSEDFACTSSCFRASCDWGQNLCQNTHEAIRSCPLLDGTAFSSIVRQQAQSEGSPIFLKGGVSSNFGRCNSSSCMRPSSPPSTSALLVRPGKLGPSALKLAGRTGGWVYAEMGKNRMENANGFSVEAWVKPLGNAGWQAGAMSGTAYGSLGYILAGKGFALALRKVSDERFTPVVFKVGPAPNISCSSAKILTATTGTFGDGPGSIPRTHQQGESTCSWIIAPSGFQSVTLVFTQFKFYEASAADDQYITIDVCSDITCSIVESASPRLVGVRPPPPFTSNTGVMRLNLNNFHGDRPAGQGFQATYATSSGVHQLAADTWYHIAVSIGPNGFGRMYLDQTEMWSDQLDWNLDVEAPFDGEYGTAIGRRSADWQDTYFDDGSRASSFEAHEQDDEGFFYGAIDELRVWKSARTPQELQEGKDWSCSYWLGDQRLVSCFSFDLTVSQGKYFPDEATENDAAAYARPAPGGTPHLPFCVNVDDDGRMYHDDRAVPTTLESWGFCSDKPRLPGAGYDYDLIEMQLAAHRQEMGTAAVLKHYPGCGEISLNFTKNAARRNGGAVSYDSCQGLGDERYCFLALAGQRTALFHHNRAGSAGGSIYIACSSLGLNCDQTLGSYNKIGALPSLPKAEFIGNHAGTYGENVATKPRKIVWTNQSAEVSVVCTGSCSLCGNSSESGNEGTITDGPTNYPNNQFCRWLIIAATDISVDFSVFDVETGYDFVTVSACSDYDCKSRQQLARLTGTSLARTEFTSITGYMEIILTTDADITFPGFVANWKVRPGTAWHSREFGPIIPGRDPVSFSVKLYDDLNALVRGSNDLAEVRICAPESSCDRTNSLIPARFHAFDKETGVCQVDAPFECPIGSNEAILEIHLVGTAGVPPLRGKIICHDCLGGQSRTHTSHVRIRQETDNNLGTWRCEECSYNEYVVDPNNAAHSCQPCPSGDLCSAPMLNLKPLATDQPNPEFVEVHSGEIWQQEGGVYMLRSCAQGYVLINSTIGSQECKECDYGGFMIEPTLGCDEDRCYVRPCLVCPIGVTCNKGSSAAWTHFQPKPLDLAGKVLPWVEIRFPGATKRLHCASDYGSGAPACIPEEDAMARLAPGGNVQGPDVNEVTGPCVDDMAWRDSNGEGCSAWNANPTWCEGSPEDGIYDPPRDYADENGIDATMACCACKPFAKVSSSSLLPATDERDEYLWEYNANVPGFVLLACPRGHQIINSTDDGIFVPTLQNCKACNALNYIIDRHMPCQKCPRGASCPDGARFIPNAKGSQWQEVRAKDGHLRMRILSCPPGYQLRRTEDRPEYDDCQRCENGYYLLGSSTWQGENATVQTCKVCPSGRAVCSGADHVEAIPGFWRLQFQYADGHEYLNDTGCGLRWAEGDVCMYPSGVPTIPGIVDTSQWGSPMKCMQLSVGLMCSRPVQKGSNETRRNSDDLLKDPVARIFKCPTGACAGNNECLQNRSGPLCGVCLPGHAMTVAGCSPAMCPEGESAFLWRLVAMLVVIPFVFYLYMTFAWQPVIPELDRLHVVILNMISSCLSGLVSPFMCFDRDDEVDTEVDTSVRAAAMGGFAKARAKVGNLQSKSQELHLPQYMKILVTHCQILGSFTMYNVRWPSSLAKVNQYSAGSFKFDILALPGLACLWVEISFQEVLFTYTLGPLAFIALLGLPVVTAWAKGLQSQEEGNKEHRRWSQTLDVFWTNTMFMLFLIYPAVSSTTLGTFNCDKNLGLLKSDYRELCPSSQSFVYWYSVAFAVIYPLGIPVFMHQACVFEKMLEVVSKKLDAAYFQAMLSTFMHVGVSLEMSRFSRLVGTCTSEDQFRKRANEIYGQLLKFQGGGRKTLDLDLLKKVAEGKPQQEEFLVEGSNLQPEQEQGNHDIQMEGLAIEDIVQFMCHYDEDGDGQVDKNEFRHMLEECIEVADLFTGSEALEKLTDRQIEVLLMFDDWPKPHGAAQKDKGLGPLLKRKKQPGVRLTTDDRAKWHTLVHKDINATASGEEISTGRVRLSLKRPFAPESDPKDISVHLLEARGLKRANSNTLLDTHFTFQLLRHLEHDDVAVCKGPLNHQEQGSRESTDQLYSEESQKWTSQTMQRHQNPEFNDVFEIPIAGYNDTDMLQVRAWGQESSDSYPEELGTLSIPIGDIDMEESDPDVESRRSELAGARDHGLLRKLKEIKDKLTLADLEIKSFEKTHPIKKKQNWCNFEYELPDGTKYPKYCKDHWRKDLRQAEELYVNDPKRMEKFMEGMNIKSLCLNAKKKKLTDLAHQLVADQIIAIPTQTWKASTEKPGQKHCDLSSEEIIIHRLGFIFEAYRVKYWWWESVEMGRKFAMTSFLAFIYPEELEQIATGALITFIGLVVNLKYTPFITDGLNSLQNVSLISQFLTLFLGILIALTDEKKANNTSVEDNSWQMLAVELFLVIMNATVAIWPLLRYFGYHYPQIVQRLYKWLIEYCCQKPHPKKESEKGSRPPPGKRSAGVHQTKTRGDSKGQSIEADIIILPRGESTKTKETMLEDGVVRQRPAQVASDVPEGSDHGIQEPLISEDAELTDAAPTPPIRSQDSIRRAHEMMVEQGMNEQGREVQAPIRKAPTILLEKPAATPGPPVYSEIKDGIEMDSGRPAARQIKFHTDRALTKSVSFVDDVTISQENEDYASDGKRGAQRKSGEGHDLSDEYLSSGRSTPSKHSMGAWLSSEGQQGPNDVPLESTTPVESLPPSPRTAALERMEQLEREFRDFKVSPVPASANNVQQRQQQGNDKREDIEGDMNLAKLFDGVQLGFA